MLTELSVENFALVEKLRLTFGPGLNLLTGETGAGKSILLDALGMVLGERTGAESVRHGAGRERAAIRQEARERARAIDLLTAQGDEIEAAAPRADEEEELIAERLRLASAEKLCEAAAGAYAALHGGSVPSAGTSRAAK